MKACKWEKRVEQWFDGRAISGADDHVAQCPVCRLLLRKLALLRRAASESPPEITESQFPAFFAGVRQGVETPLPAYRRVWAAASLGLAALIAAGSTFAILSGGPRPAEAQTVVESFSTDLQNATVEYYRSEDGTATLQVHYVSGDMW
jgi:hypothetical protein